MATASTSEQESYELVVPYEGTREGAQEFASEVAGEFGCTVDVIELSTGKVVSRSFLDAIGEHIAAQAAKHDR